MIKRMAIMIVALAIVFGAIFGWKALRGYHAKQYFAKFELPAVSVSATKAASKTWSFYLTSVGNLTAVQGVNLSTEVPGIIKEIRFESGQEIRKGDLLVQLDDRADKADLHYYQAQLKLAQLTLERDRALFRQRVISREDFDTKQAQLREAEAQVAKTEAMLVKKAIRAPFGGKLGISKVNVGQYLTPGTEIVTLQSLNPLYVNFSLPEQDLGKLHTGQTVSVAIEAYPDRFFEGRLTAVNAKVNESTHTISVQAMVNNDDRLLYPGVFANVKVLLPKHSELITIPQTAIAYSLYGDSVFVITRKGAGGDGQLLLKVMRRYVQVESQRGDEVAIRQGLKEGELVVTSGQLKLQNGTRVTIDNSVNLQ